MMHCGTEMYGSHFGVKSQMVKGHCGVKRAENRNIIIVLDLLHQVTVSSYLFSLFLCGDHDQSGWWLPASVSK